MASSITYPLTGSCACKSIRYQISTPPIITHCCHCTYCQRETGSAFAINAVIETSRLTILPSQTNILPNFIITPSESGLGQLIARCPNCHVALWSHYSRAGRVVAFVRVGTLDREEIKGPPVLEPDIHIYMQTKVPWMTLPEGVRSVVEFYNPQDVWAKECLERWKALGPEIEREVKGRSKNSIWVQVSENVE
jgi:hypothetical protein